MAIRFVEPFAFGLRLLARHRFSEEVATGSWPLPGKKLERRRGRQRYPGMRKAAAAAAGTFALVVCVAAARRAEAACSTETFRVERAGLTVTLCATPSRPARSKAAPATGVVQETLALAGHSPVTRAVAYTRLPSAQTARTIDDVPLAPLGIPKTLHLTLAVRAGTPRVEHALLIPGAVVLK